MSRNGDATPAAPAGGVSDNQWLTLVGKDMLGQYGGGKITYSVDAKSSLLISVTQRGESSTYSALERAPKFTAPDTIC